MKFFSIPVVGKGYVADPVFLRIGTSVAAFSVCSRFEKREVIRVEHGGTRYVFLRWVKLVFIAIYAGGVGGFAAETVFGYFLS